MTAVSPLAPTSTPEMPVIEGVRFATAAAGIRYKGRTDVMLALFDKGTEVAGVFTTSRCPSAPVDWCRAKLAGGKARALVVNSGNANAFTGKVGAQAVAATAKRAAAVLATPAKEIFIASTGVIGEPLDPAKFNGVFESLAASATPERIGEAATAIMTTDTFPKVATRTADLGGVTVTLNGIAKGAGMIAPDMATMLAFVFTDAPVAAAALQAMLGKSVKTSFNAITVDSDTSTSDTLMLFATGAAGQRGAPKILSATDRRLKAFKAALDGLLLDLAHQVVKDGEGARKFIEVTVEGASLGYGRQAHRALDRELAARQDGGCRQKTPIGAASSWPWARRARRPTATGSRSGSQAPVSPTGGCGTPVTTRPTCRG